MNPSYFRIRLATEAATNRLCEWSGKTCIETPRDTDPVSAVDLACDQQGNWRAAALFVAHDRGWTIFNDLSGHFSSIPARRWAGFAEHDEFFLAGYNDAIPYGELVAIQDGSIVREFLDCADAPELNANSGSLVTESDSPIESWTDVASIVDDDELSYCETGKLWLLG
jgi:hypothetical protein